MKIIVLPGDGIGAETVSVAVEALETPVVKASSSVIGGKLPLHVSLSSDGTVDFDKDPLQYEWTVVAESGGNKKVYNE
ncbi:MAG: hypothetical protein ACKO0Z_26210, partial [Betaproteobacteria bacterium]